MNYFFEAVEWKRWVEKSKTDETNRGKRAKFEWYTSVYMWGKYYFRFKISDRDDKMIREIKKNKLWSAWSMTSFKMSSSHSLVISQAERSTQAYEQLNPFIIRTSTKRQIMNIKFWLVVSCVFAFFEDIPAFIMTKQNDKIVLYGIDFPLNIVENY